MNLSGVGYHIIMVKNPNCDVEKISELIERHVPTASMENNIAAELSFILPKEYTHRYGSKECYMSGLRSPEITIIFLDFLILDKWILSSCHT